MITKRAQYMVIFAMHVIGDGSTDRYQLRSRRDWQNPATWNHQTLDIPQQNTCLTDQPSSALIKSNEVIQPDGVPQDPFWIQADITITTAITKRYAACFAGYQSCDLARVIEADHIMRTST
jgi:hypothetical protein